MKRLRLQHICHRFGYQRVLHEIDLDVGVGEVVALVGASGCGKTTLLHLAAQLLLPWSGTVLNSFERIAMMFQQPRLLPWKRTGDNIALGLKARGMARAERLARAAVLAERMGLSRDDLDKYPSALSGGMQSRVALARAFAVEPELLLLDEAFAALDIGLKSELYALLAAERERTQCAVLMITHDLMEAARLADRIVVMGGRPGKILAEYQVDTPLLQRDESWAFAHTAALLRDATIREAFALPMV